MTRIVDETAPVDSALFGRESDLRTTDALLGGVHDRGGSLTVRGGPGVGKSALLNEAGTRATAQGMRVLRVTGVQSEARLPFAGLHRLLLPLLSHMEVLATPHRSAMLAAFRLTDAARPRTSS
jgi:predicted ATP-dependent serine protease